jgi:NADH:ubiquinone oxidoreductase subunit 3 (subunit A)
MSPRFCLCLCVHICFVYPFACDYINIGLSVAELLKRELFIIIIITGYAVALLVEALRYKPEGRVFESW